MMDGAAKTDRDAVHDAAVAYCIGIHTADVDLFRTLCHDSFHMSARAGSGATSIWDKAAYLERVGGRSAFDGDPDYEILDVDVSGGEMARVKLRVSVPPRVYEDYLGFIKIGGEWKLINKLFRTASGPALEG
jgi:hypothetical protein